MGRLDKSPLPPPRNSSPHRTWWIPSHGMAVGCHPLSTCTPPCGDGARSAISCTTGRNASRLGGTTAPCIFMVPHYYHMFRGPGTSRHQTRAEIPRRYLLHRPLPGVCTSAGTRMGLASFSKAARRCLPTHSSAACLNRTLLGLVGFCLGLLASKHTLADRGPRGPAAAS